MTPVMFSYGGWQTSSFVAGEMRDPRRDLARGLLLGVAGVVVLYTAVAFVCVHALGPAGLASSKTPATDVMRLAIGEQRRDFHRHRDCDLDARLPQPGNADGTPRLFCDGRGRPLFPSASPRSAQATRVPVVAIILQGVAAAVIALSGTFGQILSYVVSVDFIFFGLTGLALFVFRRRDADQDSPFKVPGHPVHDRILRYRMLDSGGRDSCEQSSECRDRLRHPARWQCPHAFTGSARRGQPTREGDAVALHALGQVQAARALQPDRQRSPALPDGLAADLHRRSRSRWGEPSALPAAATKPSLAATAYPPSRSSPPTALRWRISSPWRR